MEIVSYPAIQDDQFERIIDAKKEFVELALDPTEAIPLPPELFLRHQRLLARYISPFTPWRDLLIAHEMGTGKTATSIAIVRNFLLFPRSPFTKIVVLGPSTRILINYQTELRKLGLGVLSKHFSYFTYTTFANTLSKLTPAKYREAYQNRIFVLDEIHRLVVIKKDARAYKIIQKFLLDARTHGNTRTILLTGTPIKDATHEIAEILNLILPGNMQLPTGVRFDREFGSNLSDLGPYLDGRVSYLTSMEDEVEAQFAGKIMGNLVFTKVEAHEMPWIQTESYQAAMLYDSYSAFYLSSRQASQFAPAPGTRQRITRELLEERSATFLSAFDHLEKAFKARQKSFVYSAFVNQGGLNIFARALDEGGWSRFSLGRAGRARAHIDAAEVRFTIPPGKRYVLLTNETATPLEANRILQLFNHPENARGQYIAAILGSPVLMEGVTIKHIRHVHVLTPEWNFYKTFQVIHRALRFGAHEDLDRSERTITIHFHVSYPEEDVFLMGGPPTDFSLDSVDLFMYETAEAKDRKVSGMMALLRSHSVDCPFTIRRNTHHSSWNASKKCFYLPCNFQCANRPMGLRWPAAAATTKDTKNPLPPSSYWDAPEEDFSTWIPLYANDEIVQLIGKISALFTQRQKVSFEELGDLFSEFPMDLVATALEKMVTENVPVPDATGISRFLREENDVFFLALDLAHLDRTELLEYTENFAKLQSPGQIMDITERATSLLMTDLLFSDDVDVEKTLESFETPFRESILEACVQSRRRRFAGVGRTTVVKRIQKILELYDFYLVEFPKENIVVSFLLHGKPRCTVEANDPPEGDMVYHVPGWKFCPDDLAQRAFEIKERPKKDAEKNPYRSYGLWNPTTRQFCIRDLATAGEISTDKRKIASGKRCLNWSTPWLMELVLRTMNVPAPDRYVPYATRATILHRIERRNLSKYLPLLDDPTPSPDRLRQLLYWGSLSKTDFCTRVREEYDARHLLFKDQYCGTQKKVKIN